MAAIFAATGGAEVFLLERTRDGGRKILISGGGRCNILPARVDERRFVTDSSPNTLRNMLRSWPLAEQIRFFETELGLTLVEEEETGKLFPSTNRARDVRDGLLSLAARSGARFLPETSVTGLEPLTSGWRIMREGAEPLIVDAVIVATGGLSVPNTGSDGRGLAILVELGHTVHPTYAALTPAVAGQNPFGALSGISLPVRIAARDSKRARKVAAGSCSRIVATAARRCSTSRMSSCARARRATRVPVSRCSGPTSTKRVGKPHSSRRGRARWEECFVGTPRAPGGDPRHFG
jgi:predicted Rossmann fold flavoprotein